ncbi:MAG: hypothetical protein H6707_14810 [Deltaproteobacteria bacterium]|nr:hypothetical protein [Deltaproteobacteria bacterium]
MRSFFAVPALIAAVLAGCGTHSVDLDNEPANGKAVSADEWCPQGRWIDEDGSVLTCDAEALVVQLADGRTQRFVVSEIAVQPAMMTATFVASDGNCSGRVEMAQLDSPSLREIRTSSCPALSGIWYSTADSQAFYVDANMKLRGCAAGQRNCDGVGENGCECPGRCGDTCVVQAPLIGCRALAQCIDRGDKDPQQCEQRATRWAVLLHRLLDNCAKAAIGGSCRTRCSARDQRDCRRCVEKVCLLFAETCADDR